MTDLTPTHHIRPAETWAAVREDYLAGIPAELVAERHGVSLSSVRTHARVEGWRRADQPAPPPPSRDDPLTEDDEDLHPIELAVLARRHAARAMLRGRAVEAARWTRLVERWDKAFAEAEQVSAAQLDGVVRLARAASMVDRMDHVVGQRMKRELRRHGLNLFGWCDDPLPPRDKPAPSKATADSPPPSEPARSADLHGLHGLHHLHGADDSRAGPSALLASASGYALRTTPPVANRASSG